MTIVLTAGQRQWVANKPELIEGVDYICYDQVPLGPYDLVYRAGRWVDRRTTDGEVLASDGRNAIAVMTDLFNEAFGRRA